MKPARSTARPLDPKTPNSCLTTLRVWFNALRIRFNASRMCFNMLKMGDASQMTRRITARSKTQRRFRADAFPSDALCFCFVHGHGITKERDG